MDEKITRFLEEAAQLHGQAKAILAEFEGKEMPQEKAQEVDRLLDQVEQKTEQSKRLQRAAQQDAHLNDPATGKAFFTQPQGQAQPNDPQTVYRKAFSHYLSRGIMAMDPAEVKLLQDKALSVGDPTAGGYLVADTFLAELIQKEREISAMRRICRILPPVPAGSIIVPSEDTDTTDAAWTAEIATGSEETVTPFGQRVLSPHALAKRVKVSNTLLRNPGFDIEAWVRDDMAYRFAVPEENGFVNGDGVGKPLGLLNTPSLPTYTTAASLDVDGDDVINWVYSLPARYAASPSTRILCNRAFIRKVRTMKDGLGQYIWQPGLQLGSPNMILDFRYEMSDRFDDGLSASDAWEASAKIAVIGDFQHYWIVDALGMSIQRLVELYAETNQTGFIGRKEADGMCVLAEAFMALVVKA